MVSYRKQPMYAACVFGPGGEYYSVWPPKALVPNELGPNKLTRIVSFLGEIIYGLLNSAQPRVGGPSVETSKVRMGRLEYAGEHSKSQEQPYAATVGAVKVDRELSEQSVLFADDWRAGVGTGHKPKHNIRAYRRASKKKPPVGVCSQGTLFEVDFAGD